MSHEGTQVAEFFNGLGVHAFILKYRTANKERPGPLQPAPLMDAQRAIRTVRAKASEFGVDPKKVGIIGFSAGGHLASTAGTHFDDGKDGDAVAKLGGPAKLVGQLLAASGPIAPGLAAIEKIDLPREIGDEPSLSLRVVAEPELDEVLDDLLGTLEHLQLPTLIESRQVLTLTLAHLQDIKIGRAHV